MKKTKIFLIGVLALIMLFAVGCNFGSEGKKYTVTFNTNSGSPIESQSIKDGEMATEPGDPTRTDYTFSVWYISKRPIMMPITYGTTLTQN